MRRRTFVTASLAALAAPSVAHAQTTPAAPPPTAPAPPTGQAASSVQLHPIITPRTPLETALIAATEPQSGEAERSAFRRMFLRSDVALILSAAEPDSPPGQITLQRNGNAIRTCLIFTSAARAGEAMREQAPLVMLTGREALERVRGSNVVININLRPYITLDAEGVEGFLALPAPAAAPAPPPPPPSAGPSQ